MIKHIQNYDVIIVGGGPTGVALGLELGLNNVKTLILEKHATPLLSPRAQLLNPRSMEFFMRWKLASELKAKQLFPPDFPIQGVWCSKLNGKTYAVSNISEQLTSDMSPQRGVRIPLWLTEDVLRYRLADFPSVTFLKQYTVTDVQLDNSSVSVTTENNLKQVEEFRASYIVACDGANSITRKKIGVEFEMLAKPQRIINVVFESTELGKLVTVEKGILYFLLESSRPGAIGPIDPSRGLWYSQIKYDGAAKTVAEVNLDALLEEMTGLKFNKKIIQANFWNMHIQIAKQFLKDNRAFLVGDSAHAFVPQGGFGLNTGLGDVVNLGWKLAAVIKHAADPALLETYEQERRPVCLNNLYAAQENANNMMELHKKFDSNQDPEGFAKMNADVAKQHIQSLGITMGYAYFNSKLVLLQKNQSIQAMEYSVYQPNAAPGYFLPHCWIEVNKSIYEVLSATCWTLIISDEKDVNVTQRWQDKFEQLSIPLNVLFLQKNTYPVRNILIRPDWHIVFANDELNDDYFNYCLKPFFKNSI